MTIEAEQLGELRKKLLDLTLRNNLLNYKVNDGRTIEVQGTDIDTVYNTLVSNEFGMRFNPTQKLSSVTKEDRNQCKYPTFSKTKSNATVTLDTPYDSDELRKKLHTLYTKSMVILEEQGYPVLYLSMGFVEWNDSKNTDKTHRAPLILLPVELIRPKIKDNYTLEWTGNEPILSISVSKMLEDRGVTLPKFTTEDDNGIGSYLDTLEQQIESIGWHLHKDIILDLFSFKKQILFEDLDPELVNSEDALQDNTLLQSFFGSTVQNISFIPDIEAQDRKNSGDDNYLIMDADSSQMAVIDAAKKGMNLVVEGAPGTGKSQTIANLIAEMLMQGKTVLFVSEKMAALEVVKRRLDSVGLSRFCLELHTQNVKKHEFLKELEICLHTSQTGIINVERDLPLLDDQKNRLYDYCQAINTPIGNSGFTPYDLIGIRQTHLENVSRYPSIIINNVTEITYTNYQRTLSILANIASAMLNVVPEGKSIANNPWVFTKPILIHPGDIQSIENELIDYLKIDDSLQNVLKDVADSLGTSKPNNEHEIEIIVSILWFVHNNCKLTKEIIENMLWESEAHLTRSVEKIQEISDLRDNVLEYFNETILSNRPAELYSKLIGFNSNGDTWKKYSSEYKNYKQSLECLYSGDIENDEQLTKDMELVKNYCAKCNEWQDQKRQFNILFSPISENENTNPAILQEYIHHMDIVRQAIADNEISADEIVSICAKEVDKELIASLLDSLDTQPSELKRKLDELNQQLNIDQSILCSNFVEQRTIIENWRNNVSSLGEWSRFMRIVETCKSTSAEGLIPLLLSGEIDGCKLLSVYILNYTDAMLKEAYRTNKPLSQFMQRTHEESIKDFCDRDNALIEANATRIINALEKNLPNIDSGDTSDAELNALRREFNRKRGHKPIRALMKEAGSTIQKIKPCFMMSPLSVAQYLDTQSVKFDIVIFDEASQIKPEDALGCLMRGKQLIVMGDSNQLPPTSFFDRFTETDDDYDITDVESLLHLCRKVYPVMPLKWHYRSRHESLITISNDEFYGRNMVIFPSPKYNASDLGLSFVHLPQTVYGRGTSGVNKLEAKEVAEAVIEHYEKHPEKTLGVATFSTRQQECIRSELEILLRDKPEIENIMYPKNGERFFVKNLETIQGDERDTIFISIGYGYDVQHRLSRNFGPLNTDGGKRRLNVLITRAREQCIVFSNFRGVDLQVDENTTQGVLALSRFLTYAETRTQHHNVQNSEESKNNYFANHIASILEENGYTVHHDVGNARFKIDLAVINPNNPDEYMAGIMCDGPNYWSAKVTRDRERLRPKILKELGWNIIHVWSAEWYLNPTDCKQALLDSLKQINEQESTSF